MHRIETQIEIAAAPERVWALLMDFPSYATWNPFVRSIEGEPEVGQQLKVLVQSPAGGAMRFRPAVLVAQKYGEFRWKGKFLVPGLLDGEHYFRIERTSGDGVVFHHGELFSGLLVPLFKRFLDG